MCGWILLQCCRRSGVENWTASSRLFHETSYPFWMLKGSVSWLGLDGWVRSRRLYDNTTEHPDYPSCVRESVRGWNKIERWGKGLEKQEGGRTKEGGRREREATTRKNRWVRERERRMKIRRLGIGLRVTMGISILKGRVVYGNCGGGRKGKMYWVKKKVVRRMFTLIRQSQEHRRLSGVLRR